MPTRGIRVRRLALRYAWRTCRASARRTAILVVLVALPVAATGAYATLQATAEPTAEERSTHALGAADVLLLAEAGGESGADPASLLPPGSRSVVWAAGEAHARANGRAVRVQSVVTDLRSPLVAGALSLVDGVAPRGAGEVALSPPVAERLGVGPGDRVSIAGQLSTVTGLVERGGARDAAVAVRLVPGAGRDLAASGVLAALPDGDVQAVAAAARTAGLAVTTRADAAALAPRAGGDRLTPLALELLALLEVGLVVGAGFALVARSRRRELALLAAAGAGPRDLRAVVTMVGLVVGALGGLLGIGLGLAASAVLKGVAEEAAHERWGALRPAWETFGIAAALGLLVALAAALVAARSVGSLDVVSALRGAAATRPPRRARGAGAARIALAACAAALLGLGWALGSPPLAVAGCLAAVVAGALLAEHAFGRLGPRGGDLPLGPRLAVRDAAASAGRATALATCIASLFVLTLVATATVFGSAARAERSYVPDAPEGTAFVQTASPGDPAALDAAARSLGADAAESIAYAEWEGGVPAAVASPLAACLERTGLDRGGDADPCIAETGFGVILPALGVAGPRAVEAILGRPLSAAEERALLAGRALVLNRALLAADGTIAVELPLGDPRRGARDVRLPALAVAEDAEYVAAPLAFVAESALAGTGLAASSRELVVFDGPPPTRRQEDAAREALLSGGGVDGELVVERGAQGLSVAARLLTLVAFLLVVTVAVVAVTSVLVAATEMTGDLAVLAAVGSPLRLRRRLAAAQSAALAGGGALAGTALGALAALTVTRALDVPVAVAPYAGVLAAAGAVVVVAAAAGYLATPSSLPVPTAPE